MVKYIQYKEGTIPYYYRYTCEECGLRTHWIRRELVVDAGIQPGQIERAMSDAVERNKAALEECVAGNRMFVLGDLKSPAARANAYFSLKCPKCKHEPSWMPRCAPGFFTKTQKKNAEAFNATPGLSRPEVVFGGDCPPGDENDFKTPCTLVISGSSFGIEKNTPIYFNGMLVGHTKGISVDLTLETYYKDNMIRIGMELWTSYIEAREGETLHLTYKNFMVVPR